MRASTTPPCPRCSSPFTSATWDRGRKIDTKVTTGEPLGMAVRTIASLPTQGAFSLIGASKKSNAMYQYLHWKYTCSECLLTWFADQESAMRASFASQVSEATQHGQVTSGPFFVTDRFTCRKCGGVAEIRNVGPRQIQAIFCSKHLFNSANLAQPHNVLKCFIVERPSSAHAVPAPSAAESAAPVPPQPVPPPAADTTAPKGTLVTEGAPQVSDSFICRECRWPGNVKTGLKNWKAVQCQKQPSRIAPLDQPASVHEMFEVFRR